MNENDVIDMRHEVIDDMQDDLIDSELEVEMLEKIKELVKVKCESDKDCCCEESKKIDFDECEDYKKVYLPMDITDCQTRLLRVLVEVRNVCQNRYLALSVILVNSKSNMIISQKGKVVFTGDSMPCNQTVSREFCFALPGDLYEDSCPLDIKVVANYIYTNPFGTLSCKNKKK